MSVFFKILKHTTTAMDGIDADSLFIKVAYILKRSLSPTRPPNRAVTLLNLLILEY